MLKLELFLFVVVFAVMSAAITPYNVALIGGIHMYKYIHTYIHTYIYIYTYLLHTYVHINP